MELRQDPLLIRSALSKDAAQLAAWWNDGAVMAHAGFPNGIGTDADTVQKQLFNTDTHRFIVEFEGIPIGEMCYRKTAPATAEIGIKICSPAYQNRGLGKALLRLFIDALFKQGFSCIEVSTMLSNHRAQHVYEQLGFGQKTLVKDGWTAPDGTVYSCLEYKLTSFIAHKPLT